MVIEHSRNSRQPSGHQGYSINIKHIKVGNDWSDSEMSLESHFAGGPMVARYCMLDGILYFTRPSGPLWHCPNDIQ